jgi:hypothetical protein
MRWSARGAHLLSVARSGGQRASLRSRNIRFMLEALKTARYRVKDTTIVQTTRLTPQATTLLKKLQVTPPKRLLSAEQERCSPESPKTERSRHV